MVIDDAVFAALSSIPGVLLLHSGSRGVYFGIGQAMIVAEHIIQSGYRILGMEGFVCDGVHLFPLLNCIADFGTDQVGAENWNSRQPIVSSILEQWRSAAQFVEFVAAPAQ